MNILGLNIVEQTQINSDSELEPDEDFINSMINQRNMARKNNQYEKADQIRFENQ